MSRIRDVCRLRSEIQSKMNSELLVSADGKLEQTDDQTVRKACTITHSRLGEGLRLGEGAG